MAGFTATKCSERRLAKALAKLTYAFANATVPKVSLLTGNAYGSAAVMMNSKAIGADLVYAWPDVKTGMMDARLAAEIMYADADADKLAEKAKEYELSLIHILIPLYYLLQQHLKSQETESTFSLLA